MAVIHYCFYCFKRIQMYQGIHRILSENVLFPTCPQMPLLTPDHCNMREIFSILFLCISHIEFICVSIKHIR